MAYQEPTTLERFERGLTRRGAGEAPNGCSYRMVPWGPDNAPAVERIHNGNREIIVGWNSEPFATLAGSRRWAICDGRHEFNPGVRLDQRRQIA